MKKFSRMPKSESGGLGGASGSSSGSGVSSYFGKVFAVGRYQVTVEELIAEGMYVNSTVISPTRYAPLFSGHTRPCPLFCTKQLTHTVSSEASGSVSVLFIFYGLVIGLHSTVMPLGFLLNICLFPKELSAE